LLANIIRVLEFFAAIDALYHTLTPGLIGAIELALTVGTNPFNHVNTSPCY
jgi:hypothetical protein